MAATTIRDNTAIGEPDILSVAPAADPNSATPNANTSVAVNLGAYATTGDGRVFRFAYDGGTALVPGTLYQTVATDDVNAHDLTCASVAVGDTNVSVTSTASTLAANALAGGFLTFTGAGGGQTYAISGNTAAAASAFTITLFDPIRTALTTPAADCVFNPYNGVVKQPTTATSAVAGAAIIATAGTQYAWLQTRGPIALQNDNASTIAVGAPVSASTTTAGAVTAYLDGTSPALIGYALEAIEGTQWGLVQLTIE